jgi:ADP-ribosyl-[dinitrogen reductase] hydrolase
MQRYLRWYRDGHLSSTGYCFDIGNTTRDALVRFENSDEPFSGPTHPNAAGNGSIMRLAPVPLFYARNPERVVERSADSSHATHGAPNCVDACRYFGALIVGAVNGTGKEELFSERYSPAPGLWEERPLASEVDEVARGSFRE